MPPDYIDFDPQPVLDAALHQADNGWHFTTVHTGMSNRILRAEADQHPPVAVKLYINTQRAEREYQVLKALREFGVSHAPEAFLLEDNVVIMSWLDGEPLSEAPQDDTMWQRLMAAVGVASLMQFGEYAKHVPMRGTGYQNPSDFMAVIDRCLHEIDESHAVYPRLSELIANMYDQIAPEWQKPAPVGLCRHDAALSNFIWDGYHLLALDWEDSDWGDPAADIGLLSAHPDYEEVPDSHWVWFRWEFARLRHDEDLATRATVYGRLGQLYWATELTRRNSAERQQRHLRERFLKRAEKLFG